MAEVEQGIYARLTGQSGVTNLISTRIYPGVAPLNATLPYIIYFKVSGPRVHAMKSDPGLAYPRIQVSTWSTSYSQSKAIALQIRTALQDFSGSTGGISFKRIFFENEYDLPEVDLQANKTYHHITQDFIAWHS